MYQNHCKTIQTLTNQHISPGLTNWVNIAMTLTFPQKPGMVYGQKTDPHPLVYHDRAGYLIDEYCETGHRAIGRFDRFGDYCQLLTPQRTLERQSQSLKKAHQLLQNGWGLY